MRTLQCAVCVRVACNFRRTAPFFQRRPPASRFPPPPAIPLRRSSTGLTGHSDRWRRLADESSGLTQPDGGDYHRVVVRTGYLEPPEYTHPTQLVTIK